jgi:hypothetical protein
MPNNWRFFWRIIFEVVDEGSGYRPKAVLEMELWNIDTMTSLGRVVVPLHQVGPNPPVGTVTYSAAGALFQNSYLEYGYDLNGAATDILIQSGLGTKAELDPTSIQLSGENVSIVVEVEIADPGANKEFPIFFLQQPSYQGVMPTGALPGPQDSIQLLETIDVTNSRLIEWQISGSTYLANEKFRLENNSEGVHRIRVRQDWVPRLVSDCRILGLPLPNIICQWLRRLLGHEYVFDAYNGYEFLVGGLQFGEAVQSVTTHGAHLFEVQAGAFRIGGTPGHLSGFLGTIKRLEFDPGNSCPRCPAVPPRRDNR